MPTGGFATAGAGRGEGKPAGRAKAAESVEQPSEIEVEHPWRPSPTGRALTLIPFAGLGIGALLFAWLASRGPGYRGSPTPTRRRRASPRPSRLHLHFFQVAYILAGPWYLTWLTSLVGLAVLFVYGMWFGLVYWRWNLIGLVVFGAAHVIVGAAGAIVATNTDAWPTIGRFFTALGAAGLTGVLAALGVVLLAGSYATMRRVTV